MKTLRRQLIAKKHHGHHTSSPNLKLPESKRVLWGGGAALVLLFAVAYYFLMPGADVVTVRRGTALSAVDGTVRIHPAYVLRVRPRNARVIPSAGTCRRGHRPLATGAQQ